MTLPLRMQTSWCRCPDGHLGSAVLRRALSSPEFFVWLLLRTNVRPHSVSIAAVSSASVIHGRTESEPKSSTAVLGTCLCWDHHFCSKNKTRLFYAGILFPTWRNLCVHYTRWQRSVASGALQTVSCFSFWGVSGSKLVVLSSLSLHTY